jgi:A/G-specific adenine glycosylase
MDDDAVVVVDVEDCVPATKRARTKSTAASEPLPRIFEEDEVGNIRVALLSWYLEHRRRLPWRGDSVPYGQVAGESTSTPTPGAGSTLEAATVGAKIGGKLNNAYGTWVSEVMLQQTKVDTVIKYWLAWMAKFPTVEALAAATDDEVSTMWAGLGYYRRAANLLKGAKQVVTEFGGKMPTKVEDLKKLSGVGDYTAGAIASIAYDLPTPLVDGNVVRVMSRLRAWEQDAKSPLLAKECWRAAHELVHPTHPGDFNQALMELGATVCTPTGPSCSRCPLKQLKVCKGLAAAETNAVSTQIPATEKKTPKKAAPKPQQNTILSMFGGRPAAAVAPVVPEVTLEKTVDSAAVSAYIAAHFPTKPAPKKHSYDHLDSVTLVVSVPGTEAVTKRYLMVRETPNKKAAASGSKRKRAAEPSEESDGDSDAPVKTALKGSLLAGQWQSIVIPKAANEKGELVADDTTPSAVQQGIATHLSSLLGCTVITPSSTPPDDKTDVLHIATTTQGEQIKHVFSHVTHHIYPHLWTLQAPSGTVDVAAWLESLIKKAVEISKGRLEVRWVAPAQFGDLGFTTWMCKALGGSLQEDYKLAMSHSNAEDQKGFTYLAERCEQAGSPLVPTARKTK